MFRLVFDSLTITRHLINEFVTGCNLIDPLSKRQLALPGDAAFTGQGQQVMQLRGGKRLQQAMPNLDRQNLQPSVLSPLREARSDTCLH